jgi:zinc transporter ZupT
MWLAVLMGAIAGGALPLGAGIALVWRPKPAVTGGLAAFGAGALLAALSVELVAPTMTAVAEKAGEGGSRFVEPIALMLGCVAGGLIFVTLDQILSEHGGYLRKTATAIAYLSHRRKRRLQHVLSDLGRSDFFRTMPPEHAQILVDHLHPVEFEPNQIIFREEEPGDRLYLIEDGELLLTRGGRELSRLKAGDMVGEIAVVTGGVRTAEARAVSRVRALELTTVDFQRMRRQVPELEEAAVKIAGERLMDLGKREASAAESAVRWAEDAANALQHGQRAPTVSELRQAAGEHSSAALAIWLGNLLDCIPEGLVTGMSILALAMAHQGGGGVAIPFTLVAGVFLSNFPEALSSSVMMRGQGWKILTILGLWLSLTIITAVGAGVGFTVGADLPSVYETALEGLAAGAMLTMIAQTMIPEAVHLGGGVVTGLSTLAGFLSAVAFKLLE